MSAKKCDVWLCATDLTDASAGTVSEAARLAADAGADLVLLHAWTNGGGDRSEFVELDARRSVDRLAAVLRSRHPSLRLSVDIAHGVPIAAILDEARRVGATRIFVGAHAADRVPPGHESVSGAVHHKSPIAVTIIPQETR